MEFGILHFYEFGAKLTYKVEYRNPSDEVITTTIESETFERIAELLSSNCG